MSVTFGRPLHLYGMSARPSDAPPLTRRNHAGAWLAMLTCPCHGVALLYLGLGTAWGATLFAYREWLFGALGVAFATGLWLLFRRDGHTCPMPARREPAIPGDRPRDGH